MKEIKSHKLLPPGLNPRIIRDHACMKKSIVGIWRDEIYHKDEKGNDVLAEASGPKCNMITLPMTQLLSALLANDPSMTGGILYHAVGAGDAAWDSIPTPPPSKFDTKLLAETSRLVPEGMTYLKFGVGTALSGTTTTIVDPDRSDPTYCSVGRFEQDGYFNGMTVLITAGTNAGESRTVIEYTQATGEIVVDTPFVNPIDATSEYEFVAISSATPTSVLEVRTTWDYGLPADPINFTYIREQGLFGGNATAAADSGYMIDRITNSRIWKDPTIKLVRFIDMIFRV